MVGWRVLTLRLRVKVTHFWLVGECSGTSSSVIGPPDAAGRPSRLHESPADA